MTLTTSQLRERIDSLDWLVDNRRAAMADGEEQLAEAARRDWEYEARHACFQAGTKGRAIWYTGVAIGTVLRVMCRAARLVRR